MATLLIIGASRGLGLEFVRQYAADGWRVLATVRDPLSGRAASEAGAEIYVCDIGDPSSIKRLAAALDGTPIDLLIHNAGIYGANQNFGEIDPADLIEVYRVNTVAPLLVAQAFAGHLTGGKLFAVLSSMMGSITDNVSGGSYAYRASKTALNMVIKTLSVDLAERGIVPVALSPGWVRTEMGGPAAPLAPAEAVAGLRRALLDVSAADSGAFIHVDGSRLPW
ncbi:SDR family oxidoreductase [Magnetospirillum molischianum]|uniref:Dehydrogenase with different specificities n=1 Tax=Magnetospirillum molischianum DSM 120 TaxID=1150626 RepID=H8FU97_MAGML|nr:SDR family oxidoreductase [Magnetospirillum molischianum]CCG41935.1 Dehydrogenase with different specificities [Magnetospirillum molischianum DSM 120]